MTKAVVLNTPGGPENLIWQDWDPGAPAPGEVLVLQTFAGLNYIDTYLRSGLYPLATMPAVLGREAAGVVETLGDGVDTLRVGDRVAYASHLGGYAEVNNVPADRLVPLPDDIGDEQAAAMMLKGMTAQYLVRQTRPLGPGDTLLYHAAAGGVGLIACRAQVPVIPARIFGSYEAFGKGRSLKLGTPVTIVFGEPILPEEYHDASAGKARYQVASTRIFARIARLKQPSLAVI